MLVMIAVAGAREAKRAGLDTVAVKSIAAIVERRARAPKVTAGALKARMALLARLEKQGLTLLPARFGTTAATPAELRKRLAPQAQALAEALARLRQRRQMTIRVRGTRPAPNRRSGAAYLASLARAARLPEADPLRRAVATLVVDERVEPSARAGFLGAVHHLVDTGDVAAYADAAAAAARRAPGTFVVTGPMIPFAFVPALDAGEEAS